MAFILDRLTWTKRKEEISKRFLKYWSKSVNNYIAEKWTPVKTQKPSKPGRPFRIHGANSPAKRVFISETKDGYRIAYSKRGKSDWAQRMEFGGEVQFTPAQLLGKDFFDKVKKQRKKG